MGARFGGGCGYPGGRQPRGRARVPSTKNRNPGTSFRNDVPNIWAIGSSPGVNRRGESIPVQSRSVPARGLRGVSLSPGLIDLFRSCFSRLETLLRRPPFARVCVLTWARPCLRARSTVAPPLAALLHVHSARVTACLAQRGSHRFPHLQSPFCRASAAFASCSRLLRRGLFVCRHRLQREIKRGLLDWASLRCYKLRV